MKKLIGFLFLLIGINTFAQTKGYFNYDSVYFQRTGGISELILMNASRGNTGAFLQNTYNGRTKFAYAVDTAYINGTNDTLFFHRGDGLFPIKFPSVSASSFIQNQNSVFQTGNFQITGNAAINAATGYALDFPNGNTHIKIGQSPGAGVPGTIYINTNGLTNNSNAVFAWGSMSSIVGTLNNNGSANLNGINIGASFAGGASGHIWGYNGSEGTIAMYNTNLRLQPYATNYSQKRVLIGNVTDDNASELQVDGAVRFGGLAVDPTGSNGQVYYNSTSNKFKGFINGGFDNLATENYVNGQFRTGNYVYVDGNNPTATDTRGSLSKYSLTVPFRTITAAYLALSGNDVLYVRAGNYSESVNIGGTINTAWSGSVIILDNCTINGGTSYGLTINVNTPITVTMINATVTNTGSASDRVTNAAIDIGGDVNLIGIGNCNVSSVEGHGIRAYTFHTGVTFSNINFSSVNGNGAYFDNNMPININNCNISSINNGGISGVVANLNTSTVSGTYGVYFGSGNPDATWNNSTITGTNDYAIENGGSGNSVTTQKGVIYNCTLIGKTGIYQFLVGSAAFDFNMRFDNVKMIVTDNTVTQAFTLSPASGSGSFVKTTNTISNVNLYSAAYRATAEGIKVISESNTNVSATSVYYGVKVGLGINTPTSQLDVQAANGYNQIRLRTQYTPTGSADANGNTGDISVDDNYIYYKTSTGWKRSSLSTF